LTQIAFRNGRNLDLKMLVADIGLRCDIFYESMRT